MDGIRSATQSTIRSPHSAMVSLCFAGMDACWIYIVAWLFSQVVLARVTNFPVPPLFALVLLELGGWGLMIYLLDRTSLSLGAVRSIMAGAGLVLAGAVAFALSPLNGGTNSVILVLMFLYAGLISLTLWLLGGYRATERVAYEDIYANFRLGLVAISVAALLSTMVANKRINDLWTELGGVGIWFFVFGLVGLALGNWEAVRRETGGDGRRAETGMKSLRTAQGGYPQGPWGWMVAASVGVILLLGLVGQAFGGQDVLSTLQNVVLYTLTLIAFALYGLVYIILWPLSLLNIHLEPVGTLQQSTPTPTPQRSLGPIDKALHDFSLTSPFAMTAELQTLFMVIAAILVVAGAVYLMTRWLRRTRPDRLHNEEEERVGFGSWSLAMAQLRIWLKRLLARFRRAAPATIAAEEDDLALLQGRAEWVGTLSVRQIYARLLKLAGSAGYPRASYQTPAEYLRLLSGALPDLRAELSEITAAYVEARYGPTPASPAAVQAATTAWRRAEPVLTSARPPSSG
jgi:Domain of unknown function (DUF4129)